MKKNILLAMFLLSGCTSQQVINENNFDSEKNETLKKELLKMEVQEKDFEEIEIKLIKILKKNEVGKKDINFNFTNNATLNDLINVLDFYNINSIVDQEVSKKQTINIVKYSGELKDLLKSISETSNLTFTEENNILKIKEKDNYKIKVVQDLDIINAVKAEIEKLEESIEDLIVSESAGLFSFRSDYKTFKKIEEVINDINNNTSLINIDLNLINVELNEKSGNGFDWNSLNVLANIEPTDMLKKSISLTTGNKLNLQGKNFNFNMVLNMLNEYGTSETIQNTNIKTLSGKKASFKTTEKTPYVDKIEVSNNGEFTETGYTIEETETGLEIEVLPFFDKESKMVNIKIDVVNSSLKGFLNIANNDIEIQRPQTEQQNFSSVIRLKVGESSVIGGIIYKKENKEGNNFINELTQSNKKEINKNALFIIIKPTVKAYIYR